MKVFALSSIKHDGKQFNEGDVIELEKDQALALIECGAATTQKPIKADAADQEKT